MMFQLDIHAETGDDGRRPFLTDLEFLQKYRMARRSFSKLVSLTKDHPVFNVSASPIRKQIPASYQLMIFLKYLGAEGGGNSNSDLDLLTEECAPMNLSFTGTIASSTISIIVSLDGEPF